MCAKLSFDATKVKPQAALEAIPREHCGWKAAIITESALGPTASDPQGGTRLALTAEIIEEGEFKGRKVFDGINRKNKNPKATQIGDEQLSALCHATGVFKLTDTEQLHNIPFELKVGYKPADDGYEAGNSFKGFRPIGGGAPAGAAPATGAAGGKPAPAWAKKAAETPPPAAATTPGKPPAPGSKGKPAPTPEPEADVAGGVQAERLFFVYLDNDSVEKTGAEIATMLGQGMPEDTPVLAQDEPDGTDWKTVADYELAAYTPPVAKPTPAAPKAPVGAAGKATPPWLKKK